ncbi:nitrogen fixation protein NifQ [Bradyrhizobium sp.]|uniref:nitrogen fixation protein NifQ n=1 Tax=Bradyrhizobium sp. TaxID=376 RepID=UPI00403793E9
MIVTEPRDPSVDPAAASLPPSVRPNDDGDCTAGAAATYFMLTGCDPATTEIKQDNSFDQHVLASILAVAATEGRSVAERAGLSAQDLSTLVAQWFPFAQGVVAAWSTPSGQAEDEEIAMVRDLLLAQRSNKDDVSGWLAAMIARRAMEPNHLWEDLGLRERPELTRLLTRHFAPLAARNTKNMKWKRFFYRMLCEDDGFVMCATPVCTQCNDFDLCFGEESGESRMAERRREVALRTAELSVGTEPSRSPEQRP